MKTLLIDLDGVLNDYKGDYNEFDIGYPKQNVEHFLKTLSEEYNIEIFTSRNIDIVRKWLKLNNLDKYINQVTNIKKPYASIIVDDRAVNFNGNFETTLAMIRKFKPYWK